MSSLGGNENLQHLYAKGYVKLILETDGWTVYEETPFKIQVTHRKFEGNNGKVILESKDYSFDLYAEKKLANGLTMKRVIEIDGYVHTKGKQMLKDKIRDQYVNQFMSDAEICRIDKAEIIDKKISIHDIIKKVVELTN